MSTEILDFTCPRCRAEVAEEWYGPCDTCRTELGAKMRVAARDVEVEAYVPKMNVVPNSVASARND